MVSLNYLQREAPEAKQILFVLDLDCLSSSPCSHGPTIITQLAIGRLASLDLRELHRRMLVLTQSIQSRSAVAEVDRAFRTSYRVRALMPS